MLEFIYMYYLYIINYNNIYHVLDERMLKSIYLSDIII